MLKKLRNKLLFLLMTVISAVMLIAFAVVYFSTYANVAQERIEQLSNLSLQSYSDINQSVPSDGETKIKQPFIYITVVNGQLFENISLPAMSDFECMKILSDIWNNKGTEGSIVADGRKWQYQITPAEGYAAQANMGKPAISEEGDYKVVFVDITYSSQSLMRLLVTLTIVWVIMAVVILLFSLYFSNRAIQPISESWEKQKRFVADASHELKTPLTRILLGGGIMKANENETVKSQEEWLDTILIGADRMSKLVNSLLTLARTEDMGVQEEKRLFDFTAIISDVMQSTDVAAGLKNLHISRDVEFIGDIFGYEESVRQVFTILYENAVKYADEGGEVKVSLRRTKKGVRCSVKNTGIGIPPKDLPYIFDRFYRADDSRSDEENSFGLGLSIAKSVAEQIGGSIAVQSVENGWTEFVLVFDV